MSRYGCADSLGHSIPIRLGKPFAATYHRLHGARTRDGAPGSGKPISGRSVAKQ
jgi:hypothetical protein